MRRALAVAACFALTGCYTIRYHTRAEAEPEPAYDKWHNNSIAGLIEISDAVDVSEICPHGVARVENKVTVGNTAADIVTREALAAVAGVVVGYMVGTKTGEQGKVGKGSGTGIATWYLFQLLPPWTPSTVRVWCAKAPPKAPEPARPPVAVAARPGEGGDGEHKKKVLKVAVIKLVPKTGVEPATVDLFTDSLVGELRKHAGLSVLSPSDIGAVLGYEKQKQLMGCSDSSCLAEIAGAMGADRLVSGNVGRVGRSLVVYLSMVDAKKGVMVSSVSERLKKSTDEDFLDALPGFVTTLLTEAPPADHP